MSQIFLCALQFTSITKLYMYYIFNVIASIFVLLYRGLDIVTNKVTQAERNLVKHHMIDFLDPLLKSTVVDFRNQVCYCILYLVRDIKPPILFSSIFFTKFSQTDQLKKKANFSLVQN